ncbi:hypothetical protein CEXT_226141 [Caerostris extrusa]|uniref:Uncharacterized protein n=1 Tax=Caerostris extrusa TaxID=172846 RepID=A0AAV4XYQ2_CAEEX|nr:hypothetical protein CEXT_226141 [Caerostris extrusa]
MECVNLLGQGRTVSKILLSTARVAVSFLSNMDCVNLLGQGRAVSQMQLATARMPVSLLSNMECVNLLGQSRPVSQIQMAITRVLSPSYQIWNALTFLDKVGRLAKYNWL